MVIILVASIRMITIINLCILVLQSTAQIAPRPALKIEKKTAWDNHRRKNYLKSKVSEIQKIIGMTNLYKSKQLDNLTATIIQSSAAQGP